MPVLPEQITSRVLALHLGSDGSLWAVDGVGNCLQVSTGGTAAGPAGPPGPAGPNPIITAADQAAIKALPPQHQIFAQSDADGTMYFTSNNAWVQINTTPVP
jgi:hypothetical protein